MSGSEYPGSSEQQSKRSQVGAFLYASLHFNTLSRAMSHALLVNKDSPEVRRKP